MKLFLFFVFLIKIFLIQISFYLMVFIVNVLNFPCLVGGLTINEENFVKKEMTISFLKYFYLKKLIVFFR